MLLLQDERFGQEKTALVVWALAFLPTRLLMARLTGLRGPARWTFLAANVHLLLRLLLALGGK